MPDSKRYIAHLDMDAFYASVELLRYPQLKGLPVVIGGRKTKPAQTTNFDLALDQYPRLKDYTGRGVVTTATYEARALGVHSAMGIMKAAKLAPDAILLPADFERYRHFSRLFKNTVAQIAPQIEDRGIDEIYIDLSDLPGIDHGFASDPMSCAKEIGLTIKDNIYKATQLTCSIGITPNKLLSKLCSDLEKPNGLTLLKAEDIPVRIWPLPVAYIKGIGPRARQKLHALEISTIGELALTDLSLLIEHFGQRYGVWLHQSAHGIDERAVETERETKSISRETTFEQDLHVTHDKQRLGEVLTQICEQVAKDMYTKGYVGRNIGIKLKFDNFQTVTRAITLTYPTQDAKTIRQAAGQCFKRVEFTRKIRLIGVKAGTLTPFSPTLHTHPTQDHYGETLPLFD